MAVVAGKIIVAFIREVYFILLREQMLVSTVEILKNRI